MDRSHTLTTHILTPTMYQEALEDTVKDTFENIAEKLAATEQPKGSCQGRGTIIAAMKSDSPPRSKAAAKDFNSPPRSSTHRQGGATAKELPKVSCREPQRNGRTAGTLETTNTRTGEKQLMCEKHRMCRNQDLGGPRAELLKPCDSVTLHLT